MYIFMTIMEVMAIYPVYSIGVFSIVVTFISTLAQKWLTNQEHLKSLKKRQKEIQQELRKTKEPKLMQELNAEMLQLTGLMFKSSMKPLFVTIIPFLILFAWLKGFYGGDPPLLPHWIWYYLGYSIFASIVFRKIFKVA